MSDTTKARTDFFVYVACDTDNIRLDNLTLDQARARVYDYMTWRSVRICRIGHMYDVGRDYNDADIIIDCKNPDSKQIN